MIMLYLISLLVVALSALAIHRASSLAVLLCMEILALSSIISWLMFLSTGFALTTVAISFWLMFFIIMGAAVGLVLLSVLHTFAPHCSKMVY